MDMEKRYENALNDLLETIEVRNVGYKNRANNLFCAIASGEKGFCYQLINL